MGEPPWGWGVTSAPTVHLPGMHSHALIGAMPAEPRGDLVWSPCALLRVLCAFASSAFALLPPPQLLMDGFGGVTPGAHGQGHRGRAGDDVVARGEAGGGG